MFFLPFWWFFLFFVLYFVFFVGGGWTNWTLKSRLAGLNFKTQNQQKKQQTPKNRKSRLQNQLQNAIEQAAYKKNTTSLQNSFRPPTSLQNSIDPKKTNQQNDCHKGQNHPRGTATKWQSFVETVPGPTIGFLLQIDWRMVIDSYKNTSTNNIVVSTRGPFL